VTPAVYSWLFGLHRIFLPIQKDDPEAFQRLRRVGKLIEGFETPYGMELLSSVHWVAAGDDEPAQTPEHAVELIFAWNAHKKKTFKAAHVLKAWQRLVEQNWLPITSLQ